MFVLRMCGETVSTQQKHASLRGLISPSLYIGLGQCNFLTFERSFFFFFRPTFGGGHGPRWPPPGSARDSGIGRIHTVFDVTPDRDGGVYGL